MTNKGEKGILTLYSDVQATSVRWLWYPFIAVGKITLLQGDPGDGKYISSGGEKHPQTATCEFQSGHSVFGRKRESS